MIPKDLEEFRHAMGILWAICKQFEDRSDIAASFAPVCDSLSTATPEQIMGMVGEVNRVVGTNYVRMNGVAVRGGDFIVTPRGEGG